MAFDRSITIAHINAVPIRTDGGVSPKMALGTMPTCPTLLVRIEDTSGCIGCGEVWVNFPPRANLHKAHIIEDVVMGHLTDFSFCDSPEVPELLRKKLSIFFLHVDQLQVFEHILAGLDITLWDLALRHAGVSFAKFLKLSRPVARCYATSINAEDIKTLIPYHAGLGQTHFKLKIGLADHGTTEIVKHAAGLCSHGTRIMIDRDQSW